MPGDYDATKREAKAFLKEIMEEFPDPEEELIEIWEAWFERMTDGNHPVYLTKENSLRPRECPARC